MTEALLLSIEIGIDPVILDQWGVEITWHGLFTALGVIIGVAVATAFARRAGYQEDTIYNVALCLVIGGIIGARALYVIENLGDFEDDPLDIIRVNTGRHLDLRRAHRRRHRRLAILLHSQSAEHTPRRGHRRHGRHSRHGRRPYRRRHQRRAFRERHGPALGRRLHARQQPQLDPLQRASPAASTRPSPTR